MLDTAHWETLAPEKVVPQSLTPSDLRKFLSCAFFWDLLIRSSGKEGWGLVHWLGHTACKLCGGLAWRPPGKRCPGARSAGSRGFERIAGLLLKTCCKCTDCALALTRSRWSSCGCSDHRGGGVWVGAVGISELGLYVDRDSRVQAANASWQGVSHVIASRKGSVHTRDHRHSPERARLPANGDRGRGGASCGQNAGRFL